MKKKKVQIPIPIIITKERVNNRYIFVAQTPVFDIASQGKTREEAIKNIKEAVELYSEDKDAKKLKSISIDINIAAASIDKRVVDEKITCGI